VRVVLVTGKGGVGKTTTAAALAARSAAQGRKTLVVSTDRAHSLADALDVPLGSAPSEIEGGLHAAQVDTQQAFARAWADISRYLTAVLDAGGIDPVAAEELTVLPGAEEVLALLAVRDAARSGTYDVVVVDCAPTADTLRLLRLPEALRWWTSRLLPADRLVARAVRRASRLPSPDAAVFEAVSRLQVELGDVRGLLTDPASASVRLVTTPESVVVAETRRLLTALTLHGYRVDGVVANRVFPSDGGGWSAGWAASQRAVLTGLSADVGGLPVWEVPYAPAEPVGVSALAALGAATYAGDPVGEVPREPTFTVERTVDGFAFSLRTPYAATGSVDLARSGDDLVVGVGDERRLLTLPSALRRCTVDGARLVGAGADARLVVRFVPDPAVWMTP
jgi:arsenite-transporting ATPase